MPILINGSQTFSKKGGFREGLQQKSKACFIFFFFTVEVFFKIKSKKFWNKFIERSGKFLKGLMWNKHNVII